MVLQRVVQVVGGLCIAIGLLSMCNNLSELATGLVGPDERMASGEGLPSFMQEQGRAQYDALRKGPYRGYLAVQGGLDSVAAVVLVVAGVGLILFRPWGRRLAIGWGFYTLASAAVYVVMMNRYLMPELLSASKQAMPSWGGAVVSFIMLLVLWAFPAALLTLMLLPATKRGLHERADRPRPVYDVVAATDRSGESVQAGYLRESPSDTASAPANTPADPPAPQPSTPQRPAVQQTWRDDPWNDPNAT